MGSLGQSEHFKVPMERFGCILQITYQEYITLYSWSCEIYHGFHNKHIVSVRHLENICTHPSLTSHRLHLVNDNGSTLDAVFAK